MGLISEAATGPKWSQSMGKSDGKYAVQREAGAELDGGSLGRSQKKQGRVQEPRGSTLEVMLSAAGTCE